MSTDVVKSLKKDLEPYDIAGSTLRIPIGGRLPAAVVRKIVKARIAENEARAATKAAAPRTKKR